MWFPGLTTGTDYFITNRSTNYVSLATTKALFTANVGVNLTQNGTNVVTATNRIYGGGATAWTDGSLVRFTTTGVAPKGLGDGRWYYIKKYTAISNAWLQFFTNKADALAGTNPIGISDVGSGTYTIKESTMVDLTGIDSGTHSIAANFIGAADGVYALDSNVGADGTTFSIVAPNRIIKRTLSGKTQSMVDLNQKAFREIVDISLVLAQKREI